MTQSGLFVLQDDGWLVSMEAAQFATEDDFQRLLERFPELLVGDQVDPLAPRRWALVKREQAVSTNEAGASLWSIDHLFLDQDGRRASQRREDLTTAVLRPRENR